MILSRHPTELEIHAMGTSVVEELARMHVAEKVADAISRLSVSPNIVNMIKNRITRNWKVGQVYIFSAEDIAISVMGKILDYPEGSDVKTFRIGPIHVSFGRFTGRFVVQPDYKERKPENKRFDIVAIASNRAGEFRVETVGKEASPTTR